MDLLLKLWLVVEACLITYGLWKLRRLVLATRAGMRAGLSFHAAFEAALIPMIKVPLLARFFATEITIFYYALAGWLKRTPPGFTAHRVNHYPTIMGVLLFIGVVETSAVHVLVARASPVAAWVLTGLSLYALIWILGDFQALRLVPTVVGDTAVHVRVGLRWRVDIPRDKIRSVVPMASAEGGGLKAVTLGIPNVGLETSEPLEARGPFGIRRRFERIALTLDDPARFVSELSCAA
jgi:hypothetical protein